MDENKNCVYRMVVHMQYKNMNFYNNIKKHVLAHSKKIVQLFFVLFLQSFYTWKKYKYIYICNSHSSTYSKNVVMCFLFFFLTYKTFVQILEESGFICYTLNNVCTLHTIGFFATRHLTAVFFTRKKRPHVFQHRTLNSVARAPQHTHTHARTHTNT